MGKPVDRDTNYMYRMWGTTSLITDYWSLPTKKENRRDIPFRRDIKTDYED